MTQLIYSGGATQLRSTFLSSEAAVFLHFVSFTALAFVLRLLYFRQCPLYLALRFPPSCVFHLINFFNTAPSSFLYSYHHIILELVALLSACVVPF